MWEKILAKIISNLSVSSRQNMRLNLISESAEHFAADNFRYRKFLVRRTSGAKKSKDKQSEQIYITSEWERDKCLGEENKKETDETVPTE